MASPAETLAARRVAETDADGLWSRQRIVSVALYWGLHAACLLTLITGVL